MKFRGRGEGRGERGGRDSRDGGRDSGRPRGERGGDSNSRGTRQGGGPRTNFSRPANAAPRSAKPVNQENTVVSDTVSETVNTPPVE